MSRGLRPLGNDTDALVAAVNRCALDEASDADRILLARKCGVTMLGPANSWDAKSTQANTRSTGGRGTRPTTATTLAPSSPAATRKS